MSIYPLRNNNYSTQGENHYFNVFDLISHGATSDVLYNAIRSLSWNAINEKKDGCSLLYRAVDANRIDVAKMLLAKGAYVNAQNDNDDSTALHAAVKNGNQEMVQLLCRYGANLNAELNDQNAMPYATPLHLAMHNGRTDIVQVLIENHADIESKNLLVPSPLFLATMYNHVPMMQLLLAAGAQVDLLGGLHWETPLHLAIQNGNVEAVRLLLEKGASTEKPNRSNQRPLFLATSYNHVPVMRLLLAAGAQVDLPGGLHGETPLLRAIQNGNVEAVRLLLEKGASTEIPNQNDQRPLFLATMYNHVPMMQLLLAAGAQVDLPGGLYGETPLHLAIKSGNVEAVQLLLEKGASTEIPNRSDQRPLFLATMYNHVPVMRLLLATGVQVDLPGFLNGETPLLRAIKSGNVEAVQLLLEKGASTEIPNRNDQRPLFLATIYNHVPMMQLLLAAGAQMDLPGGLYGETPLHLAIKSGNVEAVQLLLEKGASTEIPNRNDQRPLYCAVMSGRTNIVQLLLDKNANIDTRNCGTNRWTALWCALRAKRKDLIELLLAKGANICLEITGKISSSQSISMPILRYALLGRQYQEIAQLLKEYAHNELNRALSALLSADLFHIDAQEIFVQKFNNYFMEFQNSRFKEEFSQIALGLLQKMTADSALKNKWEVYLNASQKMENAEWREIKLRKFISQLSKIRIWIEKFSKSTARELDPFINKAKTLTVASPLATQEKNFDEADVFTVLSYFGGGVAVGEDISRWQSYCYFFGCKQPDDFYTYGLCEGKDLRAIGVDFTINNFCEYEKDRSMKFVQSILEIVNRKKEILGTWKANKEQCEGKPFSNQLNEIHQRFIKNAEVIAAVLQNKQELSEMSLKDLIEAEREAGRVLLNIFFATRTANKAM